MDLCASIAVSVPSVSGRACQCSRASSSEPLGLGLRFSFRESGRRGSVVNSEFSGLQLGLPSGSGRSGTGSWEGEGRRASGRLNVTADLKRSSRRAKYSGGTKKGSAQDALYLHMEQDGSDAWKLDDIAELLEDGAVGVIPTDTMYAFVCDLENKTAIERLYRVKDLDPKKPLSILCRNLADIDKYTLGFPRGGGVRGQTNIFRAARQCLPGPYTFILKASKQMPKQCTTFGGSAVSHCAPRKSVGVRMPDDAICLALLERLERPLLCTSVRQLSADNWYVDPAVIHDMHSSRGSDGLDFVIDGGVRAVEGSTVVDMTAERPLLLRGGKGEVVDWMTSGDDEAVSREVVEKINPYAGEPTMESFAY